ncbi:MAG: hypothetical protein K9G49_10670 [Taibaiella sp.]|nr:hypothetical protein [Taibaiella sp.]
MNRFLYILSVFLFVSTMGIARVKPGAKPAVTSKFRNDLNALIRATSVPSGFESLKQMELSRGVWRCKQDLDGFLPVVEEEAYNPASELQVSAISVSPKALSNVNLLVLKGIPGYTMKDSDKDKTMQIDRTKELRRVVFTKVNGEVTSVVTLIFVAHQYASVQLLVEAW